jgi:hypothetical protein
MAANAQFKSIPTISNNANPQIANTTAQMIAASKKRQNFSRSSGWGFPVFHQQR